MPRHLKPRERINSPKVAGPIKSRSFPLENFPEKFPRFEPLNPMEKHIVPSPSRACGTGREFAEKRSRFEPPNRRMRFGSLPILEFSRFVSGFEFRISGFPSSWGGTMRGAQALGPGTLDVGSSKLDVERFELPTLSFQRPTFNGKPGSGKGDSLNAKD